MMPKKITRQAAAKADTIRGMTPADREMPARERLKSRIMYIEKKSGDLTGEARIGRVTFSKSGKSIYYQGKQFKSLKGAGFKSNYFEVETGDDYWISGPKQNGGDRLYGERVPIEIDEDAREEYWIHVRNAPEYVNEVEA